MSTTHECCPLHGEHCWRAEQSGRVWHHMPDRIEFRGLRTADHPNGELISYARLSPFGTWIVGRPSGVATVVDDAAAALERLRGWLETAVAS